MSYLQSQASHSPGNGRADHQEVHSILNAPDTRKAFGNDRWYSAVSSADIFEIRGSKGAMQYNLYDEQISAYMKDQHPANGELQHEEPVHTRIIFIDEVNGDMDRLHITSELLQEIFATYNISPRVASLLERQHMPGRVVQYDPISQKPIHHQFWYSAIIRSMEPVLCLDSSKSVLGWMRFCVWGGRDISNGVTTILALRCPKNIKADLVLVFENRGEMVKQHPMLLHAFFAQGALMTADKFSESWADPIYDWELKMNDRGSAADFTDRSRVFLTLARQITQVATDYEILRPTLQHLKSEYEWVYTQSRAEANSGDISLATKPSGFDDIWDVYISECQLLKTYAGLYEARTRIGINECFAMVSQRDSEVNIQMAKESAQIARATHKDGQSLRAIQVLTMVFLPASLCSGIFGMGFFNTGPDGKGNVTFTVSSNWWWYLALTIPMTAFILIGMGGLQAYERWQANKRGARNCDADKDPC